MQYQNLDELLSHTCERVNFIDQFKKTEYKDVLVCMYSSVEKEFKEQLKLLNLICDTKIEKKQIKYVLRKTRWLRRRSWSEKIKNLKSEIHDKKVDMYNFELTKLNLAINSKPEQNQNIGGEAKPADTSKKP